MKNGDLQKQMLPNGPTSLCFNKEEFMKDDFNVEHFIVGCRRHAPLDVVRSDLHLYLKILQSAMIELINKDYADFLNLSTNLVGMDKAINHLIQPLNNIKSEVMSVKNAINETMNTIEERLKQKNKIREKKERLVSMMKIIKSLEEMESLLGIADASDKSDVHKPANRWDSSSDQLIERVAAEFNQLQFHVNKYQSLPLVVQIESRIKAIADTLAYSLEASLKECFMGMDKGDLVSCLRTYASIDKAEQAESIFRHVVVKEYMQEVINDQAMRDKGLGYIFDRILEFIPKHCTRVKSVTSGSTDAVLGYDFIVNAVWPEIVSNLEYRMPSLFAPGIPETFHERYLSSMSFLNKFERHLSSQASVKRLRSHPSYASFMSKWSVSVYFQIRFQDIAGQLEVALLHPFALSSDVADAQNYSQNFSLAVTCLLCSCLTRCWSPEIYLDVLLHRFWRLSLQLVSRYGTWVNEVSQELSSHLANSAGSGILPRVESVSSFHFPRKSLDQSDPSNSLPATIPPTSSTPSLQSFNHLPHHHQQQQQHTNAIPSSSPVLGSRDCIALLSDIRKLIVALGSIFENNILPIISKADGINLNLLKDAWKDGETSLLHHVTILTQFLSSEITISCASHLKAVNNIPRLFKRTNREAPTKASSFMSNLLKPLRDFLDENKQHLAEEDRKQLTVAVTQNVTEQFMSVTSEVLTSVKKMEESLKRLKAARGTSANMGTQGMSDDDKIRLQLSLDIQEFASQASKLGLNQTEVPALERLKEIVVDPTS